METLEASEIELGILDDMSKKAIELRKEPLKNRIERLKRLDKWILKNKKSIQEAVYSDFRKSKDEVDISELFPSLTEVRDALKNLKYWAEPKKVSSGLTYLGTSSRIIYEPKGLCLIISPWNYPFNLTVGPLVSAIAAGNTVVIKPSEYTPHTSQLIEEMCDQVFEENICKVYQGDYRVAQQLLEYPFDHIFFTGSPQVGKIVMEAAAKNLTSVTLELGGKSPTIVDETANIEDTAERIAWGKWLNAGQTCVAPDYMFVHEDVSEQLLEQLQKHAYKMYGNSSNYTGIVNEKHYERLQSMLNDSLKNEAEISFRLKDIEEERKMGAVVIDNPDLDTPLMQEEIFGPILPVLKYKDLDQVISFINDKPKPLSLYIFSQNKANIKRVTNETSAGSMCINDCVLQFSHPNLPFGGVNFSGIGKAHGHFGFLAFSNEKSLLKQRKGMTVAKTLYPPFTTFKRTMINLLIKYLK